MPIVELVLPKLGESIMEATILKWHKKVGDTIQLDETLLDIATDKVDSEIPSTAEGTIVEILFEINAVVPIGTVIAKIQTSGSAISDSKIEVKEVTKEEPVQNSFKNQTIVESVNIPTDVPYTPSETVSSPTTSTEAKFFSPLVMNIAQNEGISMQQLQLIAGTGSQGRVSKKDILAYLANKKSSNEGAQNIQIESVTKESLSPANTIQNSNENNSVLSNVESQFTSSSSNGKFANPEDVVLTGATEIVDMDRMRKLIAKHMMDSIQTSAHVTSFVEADVTNMVVWREKVKQLFEKREGVKLTFTPMFLECIAQVLEKFPTINCSLQGDQIIFKKDINIGMATALPSGNLIVPVIKGANQLSIVGLSKAVNALANAARNNQLKATDTQGGTFTVTNVGTFGSIMGTPVINQPQVAILALGAIKKRPVVIETPSGDAILVRHMMYLSMSYDHRIVDGAMGSTFLSAVAKAFEAWDPNRQWFQYL
ncbi:MAG: 2-oxo acid dehydrogenase subunit E2 [Chitinophagaceae bacterium]|nr:MAG: 2-oxo acid dehydrogenase subunit E2 [Chitinophagaceae bacterium]